MLYQNCEMQVFLASTASYTQPCTVRVDEDSIRIEYEEESGRCAYSGRAIGPGHYTLQGEGFEGRGTFHRFNNGLVLEGFWTEGGNHGMWRVRLRMADANETTPS